MNGKLVEDGREVGDALVVVELLVDGLQCAGEMGLGADVVTLCEIDIAGSNLSECFVEAVEGGIVDGTFEVGERGSGIEAIEVNVAGGIEELVKEVFVFIGGSHAFEHLNHAEVVVSGKDLRLSDTRGELEGVGGIGVSDLAEELKSFEVASLCGVKLSKEVSQAGALELRGLGGDSAREVNGGSRRIVIGEVKSGLSEG